MPGVLAHTACSFCVQRRGRHDLRTCLALVAALVVLLLLAGCGGGGPDGILGTGDAGDGGDPGLDAASRIWPVTVLAYNDLGMHCMNQDFSELMILPPFNTLHAQVIDRGSEEPRILTRGVAVRYVIPGNTSSAGKTSFWTYVPQLMGVTLAKNVGLTGNRLSGRMRPTGDNDWSATGIPITPILDNGQEDPYPLATVSVIRDTRTVGKTQAVVPVSWEISCNLCHNTPGISTATDILRAHDRLHGTSLRRSKPVFCGGCHQQAPLAAYGFTGDPNVPNLSHAMHGAHAARMGAVRKLDSPCYACHPGVRTQCLRGVHYAKGLNCETCHVSMKTVASPTRRPWVDEPRCGNCHRRAGFQFEQPGKLYRESKGHHGIHCAACHGSPHAITPTVTPADNVQAMALQGHAGVIDKCGVCHAQRPDEPFVHRLDD